MTTPPICASCAHRTTAFIRKLEREIASYEQFAAEVRDTSTSEQLRTHADILLAPKEQATTEAPPAPKGGELARLAGIWCNDPHFQNWIMAVDAESARKKICLKCGVTSRAELDHSQQAAQYFHKLIREPYRHALTLKGAAT